MVSRAGCGDGCARGSRGSAPSLLGTPNGRTLTPAGLRPVVTSAPSCCRRPSPATPSAARVPPKSRFWYRDRRPLGERHGGLVLVHRRSRRVVIVEPQLRAGARSSSNPRSLADPSELVMARTVAHDGLRHDRVLNDRHRQLRCRLMSVAAEYAAPAVAGSHRRRCRRRRIHHGRATGGRPRQRWVVPHGRNDLTRGSRRARWLGPCGPPPDWRRSWCVVVRSRIDHGVGRVGPGGRRRRRRSAGDDRRRAPTRLASPRDPPRSKPPAAIPRCAGASGDLYHELLPTILGQRITAGEAFAQWSRLVRRRRHRTWPGCRAAAATASVWHARWTWALHRLDRA